MGNEFGAIALTRRSGPHARRTCRLGRDGLRCAFLAMGSPTHGRDQPVAVIGTSRIGGHDLAVAHDDDAVGILQHLAKHMRNQDAAAAGRNEAPDEGEQLASGMGIERRGRLIEDDEVQRIIRHREGAGDLHHLPPPDRQIRDDIGGIDAVLGKDLVELGANQFGGTPVPAETTQ